MKAHADHVIPIGDELASVLQKLVSERTKTDSDDLVIGDVADFKKSWASATERAGVTLTFHGLRKTFASWIAEDAPYAVVQALLAHSLPDVTGRYVKVSLERMRKAIDSLPRLLEDGSLGVAEERVAKTAPSREDGSES